MASINWNDGQLVTLGQGDTASCIGGLNNGQLYCLFFYNAAGNDANTTVSVVWSNSQPPLMLTVPGTTGNQGLAALCFVDGNQTNTVSAAVTQGNTGAKVQAFICSVKLPMNSPGITNKSLPIDGQLHSFDKFTRYYTVLESHWYSGQIQSDINQFICVEFHEHSATVYIVNKMSDPGNTIVYAGDSATLVDIQVSTTQTIPFSTQGNGGQIVFMNADSAQNSGDASISLQSLSALYV